MCVCVTHIHTHQHLKDFMVGDVRYEMNKRIMASWMNLICDSEGT